MDAMELKIARIRKKEVSKRLGICHREVYRLL